MISTGDGYMQVKHEFPVMVFPAVESLGGGLFMVTDPGHGPEGSIVGTKK